MSFKYYFWVLLFCGFFRIQAMAIEPPFGSIPREFDLEERTVLLPQDDEGFEEPGCYERYVGTASRRAQECSTAIRGCTPSQVACYTLGTFVVATGGFLIWLMHEMQHKHPDKQPR